MADPRGAQSNDADDISGDEALRIAIALSLGHDPFKPPDGAKSSALVDLTQDDDEEDDGGGSHDKLAAEPPKPAAKDSHSSQSSKPASATTTSAQASSLSALFGGLDRKKMEEERLARLKNNKKRSASSALESSSPTTARPQQRPKISSSSSSSSNSYRETTGGGPQTIADLLAPESGDQEETASSQGSNSSPVTGRMVKAGKPLQQASTKPSSESGKAKGEATTSMAQSSFFTAGRTLSGNRPSSELPFPKGAIKKTWVRGQPRKGDDITIEEVFQKDKLQLAVLSTFILDEGWLFDKLDLTKTRLILCRGVPKEGEQISVSSKVWDMSREHWGWDVTSVEGIEEC